MTMRHHHLDTDHTASHTKSGDKKSTSRSKTKKSDQIKQVATLPIVAGSCGFAVSVPKTDV